MDIVWPSLSTAKIPYLGYCIKDNLSIMYMKLYLSWPKNGQQPHQLNYFSSQYQGEILSSYMVNLYTVKNSFLKERIHVMYKILKKTDCLS